MSSEHEKALSSEIENTNNEGVVTGVKEIRSQPTQPGDFDAAGHPILNIGTRSEPSPHEAANVAYVKQTAAEKKSLDDLIRALSAIGVQVLLNVKGLQNYNNHSQLRRVVQTLEQFGTVLQSLEKPESVEYVAKQLDTYNHSDVLYDFVRTPYRSTRADDEFDGIFDGEDDLDETTLARRLMNSLTKQVFKTIVKRITGGVKKTADEGLKSEVSTLKEEIKRLNEMAATSSDPKSKLTNREDVHTMIKDAIANAKKEGEIPNTSKV